jgi:hypothetical protein
MSPGQSRLLFYTLRLNQIRADRHGHQLPSQILRADVMLAKRGRLGVSRQRLGPFRAELLVIGSFSPPASGGRRRKGGVFCGRVAFPTPPLVDCPQF